MNYEPSTCTKSNQQQFGICCYLLLVALLRRDTRLPNITQNSRLVSALLQPMIQELRAGKGSSFWGKSTRARLLKFWCHFGLVALCSAVVCISVPECAVLMQSIPTLNAEVQTAVTAALAEVTPVHTIYAL
eukprot:20662-Heterococcus_DN1.PRE.2